VLFATIVVVLFLFPSCDDSVKPEKNQPPEIQSITSSPSTSLTNRLPGGTTFQIAVVATDPDRDVLSYIWQADEGQFEGEIDRPTVRWKSPVSNIEKDQVIKVTVSDGALSLQGNITIYVGKAVDPEVTTVGISNITETSARGGGEVTNDGGSSVTARGVVWSTSQGPNLESTERKDPYTTDGKGLGTFTSELTELEPGTVYYVRAYASNGVGTGYGSEIEFTTKHFEYSISGRVTEGGSGLGDVTITATGGHSQTTTTSSTGEYTLTGVPHGANVTITPTRSGYSFTPQTHTVSNITQNQRGIDFAATGLTYNISGRVTEGGSGLGGVTITASGGHSETVTTSSTGEYTVTGVPHGADVTITPTRDGYSFTPQARSISNITQNQAGIDFTATLGSYNISGRVTEGGTGLGGVTITVTGEHSQTVTTNSNGEYTITGVSHGSTVTITPTLDGYSFTPQSRSISNITQNQTGIDFTATRLTYNISGRVTEGGSGLGGVTITTTGGHSQTVTTSSIDRQTAGYYTITGVPHGADVTITPTRDGYSFTPQSRSIEDISQNETGIDFAATGLTYNISGRVTEGGSGLGGVTITASGGHSQTVTTTSTGQYTITGVPHGATVTITPTLDGYSFTPQFRSLSNITQDQTGTDFTAAKVTYSISGRVTVGRIGLGDVTITASGRFSQTVTTSPTGDYTITGVPHGANITITPSRDGYIFTPQYRSIGNITQNQTEIDFSASPGVIDIDGNVYKIVKIGTQWWMAENLRTTTYRNGVTIPNVTDNSQWGSLTTGAWAYYNNDASNDGNYGKLYNWYAVNDSRGLCPEGWRVPSDADWTTLVNYLDGSEVAGGKMKSQRTAPDPHPRWDSPNTGATNESGFSGFPGGFRSSIAFAHFGYAGFWWSSTEIVGDPIRAFSRVLSHDQSSVARGSHAKQLGFSIRCVRDE